MSVGVLLLLSVMISTCNLPVRTCKHSKGANYSSAHQRESNPRLGIDRPIGHLPPGPVDHHPVRKPAVLGSRKAEGVQGGRFVLVCEGAYRPAVIDCHPGRSQPSER